MFYNKNISITSSAVDIIYLLIISTVLEVMKIFLLFYTCHFAMGLRDCYKTSVFYIYICSFSTKLNL